jgi:uncharacterized C2H2 Zn-finger protein
MINRKAFEVVEYRRCPRCNQTFGVNKKQMRKIYCDDCKKDAVRERKHEYYEENRETIRIKAKKYRKKRPLRVIECSRCGKGFKLWRGKTTICIDCLMTGSADERKRAYLRNVIV